MRSCAQEAQLASRRALHGQALCLRGLPAGPAPEIHVHTLRHSVASFLAAAGLPPSDLADVLGHADGGALALRAYVHPFQENKRLAADHLDRAIGDAEQPIGLQSVA